MVWLPLLGQMSPSLDESAPARWSGMTGGWHGTEPQEASLCLWGTSTALQLFHLPYWMLFPMAPLPRTVPTYCQPDLGKAQDLSLTCHSRVSHVGESDSPSWSWWWHHTRARQKTPSSWTCTLHLENTGSYQGTKLSVHSSCNKIFEQRRALSFRDQSLYP